MGFKANAIISEMCFFIADISICFRSGMQAESDIGPSLVLPSISEDDENQSDSESKRVLSASPSKSPARSPRHGKFLQR